MTPASAMSLRGRLVWRLLPALLAALLAAGIASYLVARHSADFAYDQALVAAAADIASGVDLDDGHLEFDLSAQSERILRSDERDDIFFSVWTKDGEFLGGDRDLASTTVIPVNDAASKSIVFRSKLLRAMSLGFVRDSVPIVVTIAETIRKRQAAAWTAFAQIVVPTALVLLVGSAIMLLSVRGGLAPLAILQDQLESRSDQDLSPVDTFAAPLEVRALVSSLNRLLARLDAATQAHQSFVADAAHQLRTPLAGIRAQIDLLALESRYADESWLHHLQVSVARATRLSSQLLALARTGKDARPPAMRELEMSEVVGGAADTWVHRAILARVDLGFALRPGSIRGDPHLLREMLDNVIDNALRHTPPGGSITVETKVSGTTAVISVDDSGPGVPETLRERVFERFYREADDHESGSGLGLAIVRQIAAAHDAHATIRFSSLLGGARVNIAFPALHPTRDETGAREGTPIHRAPVVSRTTMPAPEP